MTERGAENPYIKFKATFQNKIYTQPAWLGIDDNIPFEDPWCFVKNANRAICYATNDEINALELNKIYEVSFGVNSDKFPELADEEVSATIVLPPVYNKTNNGAKPDRLIAPQMIYNTGRDDKIQLGYFSSFTPIIVVWQKLSLAPEQLSELKELTGKYELTPRDIPIE